MKHRFAFAVVVAGHLGLAALLSNMTTPRLVEAPSNVAMAMVEIAAPQPRPAVAPAPRMVALAVAANVEVPRFEVADADAAVGAAAAGPIGCDLTDAVATGLRDSGAVRAALQGVPLKARSVANAMMVWNGAWADAASLGSDAALEAIRETVAASVRRAPAACRDATQVGPRLILVADASGTAILSLGSGAWSWGQLLQPK